MTEKFQRRIYNAYKNGTTWVQGNYEYTIQYNPMSLIHAWIVRKRHLIAEDWQWIQPLDLKIN